MEDTTGAEYNGAQEQADAYAETLADIWATVDGTRAVECDECGGSGEVSGDECDECEGSGEVFPTDYEGSDPLEYLDDMPLEIVWEKGEPFAVVFGVGGPHTELTGGGRASGSGYVVESYWGGWRGHARSAAVQRTGDYFRERCEEW